MKSGYVARAKIGIISLGLMAIATSALASGGGEIFAKGLNYLPIKPVLVVNYGGVGKVKYIKAEISLRVESNQAAQEVSHHMPLVRDALIILISSMTDEQMASSDGKELMRKQALAKVNEVLAAQIEATKDVKNEKDEKDVKKTEPVKASKDKAKLAKDDKVKPDTKAKKAEHNTALISDLLFDNLVVQR